jgi:hypothetical protein
MTDGKIPEIKKTSPASSGQELYKRIYGGGDEALKNLVEGQNEELNRIGKIAAQTFTARLPELDSAAKLAAEAFTSQNRTLADVFGSTFLEQAKTLADTIGASGTAAAQTISALNSQTSALSSVFAPSSTFLKLGDLVKAPELNLKLEPFTKLSDLTKAPSFVELAPQPWSALSAMRFEEAKANLPVVRSAESLEKLVALEARTEASVQLLIETTAKSSASLVSTLQAQSQYLMESDRQQGLAAGQRDQIQQRQHDTNMGMNRTILWTTIIGLAVTTALSLYGMLRPQPAPVVNVDMGQLAPILQQMNQRLNHLERKANSGAQAPSKMKPKPMTQKVSGVDPAQ